MRQDQRAVHVQATCDGSAVSWASQHPLLPYATPIPIWSRGRVHSVGKSCPIRLLRIQVPRILMEGLCCLLNDSCKYLMFVLNLFFKPMKPVVSSLKTCYVCENLIISRANNNYTNNVVFFFQNTIIQTIFIQKSSLYRMVLRYVNPNPDPIIGKITITPDNSNEIEQK